MYFLEIYERSSAAPIAMRSVDRAEDALELIPAVLAEHSTCERIVVLFDSTRLFVVDCKGNRIGG